MAIAATIRKSLPLFLFVLAFVSIACHLGQDAKTENTLSFSKHFDSLSRYDSVVIEIEDADGELLDVIFEGKVDSRGEIEKLEVAGWDGGPISIVITGFMNGSSSPAYRMEKQYDGNTRVTGPDKILIHPNPGMSATSLSILIYEGRTQPLPSVEITPSNLADMSLRWSSDNPGVVAVQGAGLEAISQGTARVTARLNFDITKSLVFEVQVLADPGSPNSLTLDRDTLHLAQNGATGRFGIDIKPAAASADVAWRLSDSTIAELRSDGSFAGLKKGVTRAWAFAKAKPSVTDSGFIVVSEPVQVSSVRFLKDSLTLFVGGASESLEVEVLPLGASRELIFTLIDGSKASLSGNVLSPLEATGSTAVIVRSKEDTSKSDTLRVIVLKRVVAERVEASLQTLTLFRGGPGRIVTAVVHPAEVPQAVKWRSLTPAIATVTDQGEIKPGQQAGLVLVLAVSLADSSKKDTVEVSVKVDPPKLIVAGDTSVSVGARTTFQPKAGVQEYGEIVMFKWDLDGNQEWEDSSVNVGAVGFTYPTVKTYMARFLVRDTEGNEAVFTCRVSVVGAASVVITAPPDNFYTNQKSVKVDWQVNGRSQDSLTTQLLVDGRNVIERSAKDSAGKTFTATVVVYLDTVPPSVPKLTGTTPTNAQPRWIWSSGGGGGSGDFRHKLGEGTFAPNAAGVRDTAFTLPGTPAAGTVYTLFVQERDAAGNWSPSASLAIRYDNTKPVITFISPQASGTHYLSAATVTVSGTIMGPNRIASAYYRLGSGTAVNLPLQSGGAWSIQNLALTNGQAIVLTVAAVDSLGNPGEAVLTLFQDSDLPPAPTISPKQGVNVKVRLASWNWLASPDAGGSGFSGKFRHNLNAGPGGPWTEGTGLALDNAALREGRNYLYVQQQDRAGNWSASAKDSVMADTRGPALIFAGPVSTGGTYTETSKLTVDLRGTVVDTGIGVKEVACALSGKTTAPRLVATLNGSNWTLSTAFKADTTQVVCTALDNFDNSTQSSITVAVKIPRPVIEDLSVRNGMVTSRSSFTVSYKVTVGGNTYDESTPLTLNVPTNTFTLRSKALNIAGEPGELPVTYYWRPNVVFVDISAKGNNGKSASNGDGTSWGDAFLTFHEAMNNPRARQGGSTQIWISRGEYLNTDPSTIWRVEFPKGGALLGGFDAQALPRDTSTRNATSYRTILHNYNIDMDTLNQRLDIDGFEFANVSCGWDIKVSSLNGGTISLRNSIIQGLKFQQDYWSVSSSYPVNFEMIRCVVTNTYRDATGFAGDKWNFSYLSPGTFTAVGSRFERSAASYISIFLSYGELDFPQSFRFDNSVLNYTMETGESRYQISVENPRADFRFFNGTTIRGGLDAIRTTGTILP